MLFRSILPPSFPYFLACFPSSFLTYFLFTNCLTLTHSHTSCTSTTSIHSYILTHVPYIHAYIHTYMRTYIHTYIHTYMHTYIYTYMCVPIHPLTHPPTLSHTNHCTHSRTYLQYSRFNGGVLAPLERCGSRSEKERSADDKCRHTPLPSSHRTFSEKPGKR